MKYFFFLTTLFLFILMFPLVASAYVGPGAGLTAIGSALALVVGILFAIVGFIWYPIKRMLRKKKDETNEQQK